MSIHDGHRQRLKERYLANGPEGMSEHEILELILTYAIPRHNVNPLAHTLIRKYGSLESVFKESPAALASNEGVSTHTAVLLKLFGEAMNNKLYARDSMRSCCMRSVLDAMELSFSMLEGGGRERCCVFMLDAHGSVTDHYIEEGEEYSLHMDVKRLVSRALACGACSVVIAHSHPGGSAEPSLADIELNSTLTKLLSQLHIALLEQLIVGGGDCYAMLHDLRLSRVRGEENCGAKSIDQTA